MSFLLKTIVSLYILSVLLLSSQSQAHEGIEYTNLFTQSYPIFSAEGVVDEFNGYLFFEDADKEITLIHSNSFKYFKGKKLPLKVRITAVSIQTNSNFNDSQRFIQIFRNKILN